MLKIKRTIIVRVERNEESEKRMNNFVLDFPYYKNNVEIKKNEIIYSGPEVRYFINYMDNDRNYDIKTKVHKRLIWG
jgi:hypothetical protein